MLRRNHLHNIIFGVIIIAVLTMPVLEVAAFEKGCKTSDNALLPNPLCAKLFSQLVASIADLAIKIGIPIAVIFIIYSGLLFVTARGNETKLATAKTSITWAIIGTAILLGAWVIAEVLQATIETLK